MNAHLPAEFTEQMLHRVCSEYVEMPGLRLTRRQAQRLWGLDEETCSQVLSFLVEAKFLCRTAPDMYGRATDGVVAFPPLRMAKAQVDEQAGAPRTGGTRPRAVVPPAAG